MEEDAIEDQSKPVMLFGRDIRTIPCFKYSMLYGIYGGLATGLVTFLLTSRSLLATKAALGSYMGIATAYWCHCRYYFVKNKYTVNEIHQFLACKDATKKTVGEYIPERPNW